MTQRSLNPVRTSVPSRLQQLQQLDQQVRDMSWKDLQKYAHSLGVFGKVKRETMERRCFEVHRSLIAEDG